MKRLTKESNVNGYYYYEECFKKCNGEGMGEQCSDCDLTIDICNKLGRYEDLEEKGLVLRRPVGIGELVYEIIKDETLEEIYYIGKYKVQDVSVNGIKYADEWRNWDETEEVYFNREEAEEVLKFCNDKAKRTKIEMEPITEKMEKWVKGYCAIQTLKGTYGFDEEEAAVHEHNLLYSIIEEFRRTK